MAHLVTLDQAKEFLRVPSSLADAQIQLVLDAAEDWLARTCGTAFRAGEFTDLLGGTMTLRPKVQPVVSITEITDLWTGDVEPPEDYRLVGYRIMRGAVGEYPYSWCEGPNRYQVKYIAGYNNGDEVKPAGSIAAPNAAKLGLLYLLRRAYEARGVSMFTTQGMSVDWGTMSEQVLPMLDTVNHSEFC